MLARLVFLLAFLFPLQALAGQGLTPESIKGGTVLTVEEAKAWFDSGKALFVDVRNPINYGRGHIRKAHAAPYDDKKEGAGPRQAFLKNLPSDKGAPIVMYSHGETGWKSFHVARDAIKAGYRNVMWMREGFKGWEARGFAVSTGLEEDR